MKIAISILNAQDQIKELDSLNSEYLHIDIMDGMFVPNKSFDDLEIVKILENTKTSLDIHLMVTDIYKYIDQLASLKPEIITFHYEATNECVEVINYIHNLGIKAGISIKPNTPVKEIIPYLSLVDLVLVMSVEPGKGGQSFINDSINKIDELKELKGDYLIEVDGGINKDTINLIKNADIAVIGSYITKNISNYEKIKEVI